MKNPMTLKEFADKLTGRTYRCPQFTKEEIELAKELGIVIVYGASDDLMIFAGAIDDDVDCFDGGIAYLDKFGLTENKDLNERENLLVKSVKALWCEEKDEKDRLISWTYQTDIPHETFEIKEDNDIYCRGIVFSIYNMD